MAESTRDLLIEIGTEELPPKALLSLVFAFRESMQRQLDSSEIGSGPIERYAAPRRLALLVRRVEAKQNDKQLVRRGPSVTASFDKEGKPTKAALGFARSCGTEVDSLEREMTKKGEWLCFRAFDPGKATAGLIPSLVEQALSELPIPKRMRWGEGEAEFVRPVHWACVVFGERSVAGKVLDVQLSNKTRGHRFHHPEEILVERADSYAEQLENVGKVLASFEERRATIAKLVESITESEGLVAQIDSGLLDEVTALVEWPVVLLGRFDEAFLAVPPEVLTETMQQHQKYFPVRDPSGSLVARFVVVANIESRDPDLVRQGNERVIRPRFSDAKFFWEQDLKRPFLEFFPRLEEIVYQERLGSIADKCRRVEKLAALFAERLNIDDHEISIAAKLSKCDLVSAMVGEFPSLQGTMGRYYASRSGASDTVCRALEEQYWPRFAGDRIPSEPCGQLLGVADRLDTLAGVFGVGLRPTGTKDPYGLRRASISVVRILIEAGLPLDLLDAAELAEAGFPRGMIEPGISQEVFEYVVDRLSGYYQEQGIGADSVSAALATGETKPLVLHRRIIAVNQFRALPEAGSLAAANKRISNLLSKAGDLADVTNDFDRSNAVDVERFETQEEHELWTKMSELEDEIRPLLDRSDFEQVLERLAKVREPVDRFFDNVMVNVEEEEIKKNRIVMLGRLMAMFLRVADISKLR